MNPFEEYIDALTCHLKKESPYNGTLDIGINDDVLVNKVTERSTKELLSHAAHAIQRHSLSLEKLRSDYDTLLDIALNLQKEICGLKEEITALINIASIDNSTRFNLRT